MLMAVARHGIADAKDRLRSVVPASERGERVTVAPRGKPAAGGRKRVDPALLDWLEQQLADLPASREDSVEQLDALRGDRCSG